MAPLLPRERRAHGRTPVIAGLSRALPPALQPQLASPACGYCHNIAEQASLSTWQIAPGQCLPATCAELLDETSTPPLVHPLLMVRGLWLVPDAGRISSSLMYQHGMRSRSLPPRLTVSRLPPTIVLGEVRRSARGWPTLPTSPRPLQTFASFSLRLGRRLSRLHGQGSHIEDESAPFTRPSRHTQQPAWGGKPLSYPANTAYGMPGAIVACQQCTV